MSHILVVWDFDWSMINENSDSWIIKQINANAYDKMCEFITKRQFDVWTDLVNHMLHVVHEEYGIGRDELVQTLQKIPFHHGMITAVKDLHNQGCRQIILSDANTEFIHAILEAHELSHIFHSKDIITNPSQFDEQGRLHVRRHQDSSSPHNCKLCPINLCKGIQLRRVMTHFTEEHANVDTFTLYIGDGKGDLCACLKLRCTDVVFARRDYALHRLLSGNEYCEMQANMIVWSNGDEALSGITSTVHRMTNACHNTTTTTTMDD